VFEVELLTFYPVEGADIDRDHGAERWYSMMTSAGIPHSRAAERYSIAYVSAIMAEARCHVMEPNVDIDGWDAFVSRPGVHKASHSPTILLQVKARTINGSPPSSFALDLETYRKLSASNRQLPAYLAVVWLTQQPWIATDDDSICLRRSAYWGPVAAGAAASGATATVELPNRLDAASVIETMESVTV